MAFRYNSAGDTVKVISRHDDAIPEDLTDQEFEAYQATFEESHLRLVGNPTRFVIKRTLPYGAQQEITNQQFRLGKDGKPQFTLGYILEEVRCALTDIENPEALPEDQKLIFKRDADGFASKELIAKLNAVGIVSELFSAKQTRQKEIPEKK